MLPRRLRLNSHAVRFGLRTIALLFIACPLNHADCNLPGHAQNTEAQNHADQGLQLARAGNLESAEAELRRAVELEPRGEAFLSELGTILAMEKKFEQSSSSFQQALKLDSHDLTSRRYLAANLWQERRLPEAKQNLEILLQQKPGDQQALLLLGMVAENMKDYATAAKVLASVASLVRERPESLEALARSYYHVGRAEQARNTLGELQDLPSGARGVYRGSQIADEMADYTTAEKLLSSIQSTYPDRAEWGHSLALVQYHEKHFDAAQNTLAHLLESGIVSAEIYNLLGWCDQQLHQSDQARAALAEAIRIEPEKESNFLDLIQILLAQRRFSAALETARRTAEAFPPSARLLLLQGAVELEMEQYTDSVNSYSQSVSLDPNDPDCLLGLAKAQSAANRNREAAATLEKARNQFPTDARFPTEQGLLYLKQADAENKSAEAHAEQMLRLALRLDSSQPEAHYQLGNLALKKGQLSEALGHLKAAAKVNPDRAKIHFALARVYRRLGRAEDADREMNLFEKLKDNESPQTPGPSPGAPGN